MQDATSIGPLMPATETIAVRIVLVDSMSLNAAKSPASRTHWTVFPLPRASTLVEYTVSNCNAPIVSAFVTENTTSISMTVEPPVAHGGKSVEVDELVVVTVIDVRVVVGSPIVVVGSRRVVVVPERVVVGPPIVLDVVGVASTLSSEPPQPATKSSTQASIANAAITSSQRH